MGVINSVSPPQPFIVASSAILDYTADYKDRHLLQKDGQEALKAAGILGLSEEDVVPRDNLGNCAETGFLSAIK